MGTTCAAYGCTNRGKKGSTVRFHKFPSIKRADLRKKWTLAMKRKDFSPSASTTVCSDHFSSQDYEVGLKYRTLKRDAIPVVYTSEKETNFTKQSVPRFMIMNIYVKPEYISYYIIQLYAFTHNCKT